MWGQEQAGMTEKQQGLYLSTLAARLDDAMQLEADAAKLEKVGEITDQIKKDAERLN